MTHHARLLLRYPPATAAAILGALRPEAAAELGKSASTLATTPDGLAIDLDADDLATLRAALNSHLRWVDAAERATRLAR